MLVLLAEQDQQTLAILYILHSNLQKEYGLDQIPQEIVTPQSVQAVKDMPQQREYEIKNHGTDEATAAQNVIVSQNNNKQNNVSVNQRASEKKQTLNRLSANRGTKAVKGSEKSPLLKGKLLSKLVKKIRGGDQNPNRLAEVVRQLRRKDRV